MKLVYPQLITGADLLRGISKLNYVAPLLERRGAKVAAIVNSKMYGVRSFYKVLKKYNIHPVIGLTVNLEIDGQVLLVYIYAKDNEGYQNLLKISSAVSVREPEQLPLHWLDAYRAGCIIVCPMTDSTWAGARKIETIKQLSLHSNRTSISIGVARPGGIPHAEESEIEHIAETSGIPIVGVYESRFINPKDAFSYKVATAIRLGEKLSDNNTSVIDYEFAYMPEEEELKQWFSDRLEWLDATSNLLLSCHAELPQVETLMPKFPILSGEHASSYLKKQCEKGLLRRLGKIDEIYRARLNYELNVIDEMDYADYFLIVEDFMRFASEQKILTGPGRGSSAGSLVAFSLAITDVDPIHYGLVFERFLNPERITMPDIDIDFADNRRVEVINYVAEKYGKNYVAQIITFGTLSARAVVRNVARVFGFSAEEMTFLANEIPSRAGIKLQEAYKESTKLQNWIAMDPVRSKWFDAATALEGLPRNASTHAAGVILSPTPLVDTVPLQEGGEGIYLTQWPMKDVEEQGLLKMDFLGLRNLTLLDRIRTLIFYSTRNSLDFEKIPLDDNATFNLFKEGDTSGIFQFESDGMRETLRLIKPNRFEDLFAINALYRPGPMDNIPLYARRKHGKEKISYVHSSLESILEETYGVIVYQEQIMQIAVKFANYTLGEADLLRRAISKKKHDDLNDERIRFTSRALENGMDERTATEIYDLIVKFADYGFPKSHAVAYSLISYRLAYLKANQPAYFYAALLSTTTGNNDKTADLIREVKIRGIKLLPPSINSSKLSYSVEGTSIRMGLSSVRGVTRGFYNTLNEARSNGSKWRTLFDFAVSMGVVNFTEKVIVPLIKAGALDEFGEPRSVLLASIDAASAHALFIDPSDSEDLLAPIMSSIASPKYSPGGNMPRLMMLEYEKEVLGFYLSDHPAVEVKKQDDDSFTDISAVEKISERSFVRIVGLITEIKRIRTKKGEAMAFISVQDETGSISCTFFPKQYSLSNSILTDKQMIKIEGTIERRGGKLQILVNNTESVEGLA